MIKKYYQISSSKYNHNYFVTTWVSPSGSISFPVEAGEAYNFEYRVDGGAWATYNTTAVSDNELFVTGLPTTGIRVVEMNPLSTVGIPSFRFKNAGNRFNIRTVEQFGTNAFSKLASMFFGCVNLTEIKGELTVNLSVGTRSNFDSFIRNCSSLVRIDTQKWANVNYIIQIMNRFAYGASSLGVIDFSTYPLEDVSDLTLAFTGLSIVNIDNFMVENLTSASGMMSGGTLNTSVYNQTLINWASQNINDNVVINFGSSQYSLGSSAEDAKNFLTAAQGTPGVGVYAGRTSPGWKIIDGGGI